MSYTPKNLPMFVACYAGAVAGMGASDRVPTSANPVSYLGLQETAFAFAEVFDNAWNDATTANELDLQAAETVAEGVWQGRAPLATPADIDPANPFLVSLANACVAMIHAGDTFLAGKGITPPSPSGYTASYAFFYSSILDGGLINAGSPIPFSSDGPTSVDVNITRVPSTTDTFQVSKAGDYSIDYQVPIFETNRQLGIFVSTDGGSTFNLVAGTDTARSVGGNQLNGSAIVRLSVNDQIQVINMGLDGFNFDIVPTNSTPTMSLKIVLL